MLDGPGGTGWLLESFKRCHQGVVRGMDGGKFKRKLSEVNTRAVSRGQNKLVGKFKMAAGDMVSIRGQVIEYTYPFDSCWNSMYSIQILIKIRKDRSNTYLRKTQHLQENSER